MSKYLNILFLSLTISFFSCKTSNGDLGEFTLLPGPQYFEINGISNLKYTELQRYYSESNHALPVIGDIFPIMTQSEDPGKAEINFGVDPNLDIPAEGYELEIKLDQISITGVDPAGLFYGFKTLEQLMVDCSDQKVNLPMCKISDYPKLEYRSIQLDIKHHLEKTEYYYDLIDKLASYKINGILVEMEDKIKYERQSKIGSADALSISDWKKLSEYAFARNIRISPLIQGLGHASFILKHDMYKHLRDNPESDWAFNPLDPETYEVQFDLYLDAIEATPHGKYLHIGGDEVHTTGRGSGKSALELQLIWLDKVCKFADEQGRIPIFWDDMPLKHAGVYRPMFNTKLSQSTVDSIWDQNEHKLLEFLDQFPTNCIYMRWNYSSSEALGNGKAMQWFSSHGLKVMGATAGQTRWVLMPQRESNMDNIRSFAESSIDNNLGGLLLTLWDDDSPHFELYNRGIIIFAESTWSGGRRSKAELKSAYRQREFSHSVAGDEYAFIDNLELPVAFWKNALLNGNRRNYLKKSNNPLQQDIIDFPDRNNKGDWSEQNLERLKKAKLNLLKCDSISQKIMTMKSRTQRNSYTLDVYQQVNNLVRFSSQVLLDLEKYDLANNSDEESMILEDISNIPAEFKKLRIEFEKIYGKTRILTKPKDYILDQDHHVHLANQSNSFDWQFYAEMLFMEKLEQVFGVQN